MFSSKLRQPGFTLLEVLVTLAIVAIVATIAIPSMRGILGDSELSAASNQLVFSLQSARSEAIKRISPVSLCPSADPDAATPVCGGAYNMGWIVFVDANGNGVLNDTDDTVILRSQPLSAAFSVQPAEHFNSGVTFSISGVSTNSAGGPISGELQISHVGNGGSRSIRIAASGRISATVPEQSSSADGASTQGNNT